MIVDIHLISGKVHPIEVRDQNHFMEIIKNINLYQAFISTNLYIPRSAILKVVLLEEEITEKEI